MSRNKLDRIVEEIIADASAKLSAAHERAEAATAAAARYRRRMEAAEHEVEQSNRFVAQLEDALGRTKGRNKEQKAQIRELTKELAAVRAESRDLKSEVGDCRDAADEARSDAAELRMHLRDAESQLARYLGIAEASLTIIAVYFGAMPATERETRQSFPANPDQVAQARQAARARLGRKDLSDEARARVLDQARQLGVLPPDDE